MKGSRFLKPGWLLIYLGSFIWIGSFFLGEKTYNVDTTFRLDAGATIAGVYEEIDASALQKMKLRRFMKQRNDAVAKIQPGSYIFSGSYTASELLEVFLAGPSQVYEHITLLEGRSMYDIDASLTKKGLIEAGEYIDIVTDQEIIATYIIRYEFLAQAAKERDVLVSLEGYLYPDTYFVDPDKDVIDQLLDLQLEGFNTNIWKPYAGGLLDLSSSLEAKGYDFRLSTYGALVLASIIEKEERYGPNRPEIASVFYNRLDTGMRLDADISLCYGLETGYEACTPEVIVNNLQDTTNLYNTRALGGLPPTPIVSPTVSSVSSLIDAKKTSNFFYLHDPEGNLHTAETNAGHVTNKQKYLQ